MCSFYPSSDLDLALHVLFSFIIIMFLLTFTSGEFLILFFFDSCNFSFCFIPWIIKMTVRYWKFHIYFRTEFLTKFSTSLDKLIWKSLTWILWDVWESGIPLHDCNKEFITFWNIQLQSKILCLFLCFLFYLSMEFTVCLARICLC